VSLLGGLNLRHKSQHRGNHGGDMQQPTHLSGLVQPYRVAKREVVRPEHPDAFVRQPDTNAVNLSTEPSTCGRWYWVSAGKLSSRWFGAAHFRLVRALDQAPTGRFENRRRPRARFTVPAWAESHVDHQKDLISLSSASASGDTLRRRNRSCPDPGGQVRTGAFAAMSCKSDSAAIMNRYD
jgi:hypothetical protein